LLHLQFTDTLNTGGNILPHRLHPSSARFLLKLFIGGFVKQAKVLINLARHSFVSCTLLLTDLCDFSWCSANSSSQEHTGTTALKQHTAAAHPASYPAHAATGTAHDCKTIMLWCMPNIVFCIMPNSIGRIMALMILY
jgi:hypothetical protein